jgi:hypothetical protein
MPSSNTQKSTKFAPAAADEKRFDVAINGDLTSIKLSSWVDGLGWCGQKTIEVEPEMLDVLHKMIGAARLRLRHQREMEGCEEIAGKILDFPVTN